jgi:hypothetical protein
MVNFSLKLPFEFGIVEMLKTSNRQALRYEAISVSAQDRACRVSQRREAWGVCYWTLSALGILVSLGKKTSRVPESKGRGAAYVRQCLVPAVPRVRRETPWE